MKKLMSMVIIVLILFTSYKIFKRTDENFRNDVNSKIIEFKPYAESIVNKLPLKHINLDNVNLDNESINGTYKDDDGNIKSFSFDKSRTGYFSFDKVEIMEDNKLKEQDKPYLEYRYVEERIPPGVTYANGVDPKLSVEKGYYSVKIVVPKGYFKK